MPREMRSYTEPGDKAPTSLLQEGLGSWSCHRNCHKDTQEILVRWPRE